MLTKKRLQDLKEDALRTEVIIPLLKLMGHQDVRLNHGGIEEQGKDIISWKPNDLGGRTNYAIVVKSTSITGQANTRSGSAGEVLMQIQQCFGASFHAPTSLESHPVHVCWVVTNQNISTSAFRSLESSLRASGKDRYVEFIDGAKLWELVELYMPTARAVQMLEEARQVFDELDTRYRPTVSISGGNIVMGIEPKFPETPSDEPFDIEATVKIPATPEHEQLIQSMHEHIETGAPVEIPGNYVHFSAPEGFAQLFGSDFDSVRLGPIYDERPILAHLELTNDDGERCDLEYVHFTAAQIGTGKVTLTNENQPIPIHLKLAIRAGASEGEIEWQFAPLPMNVHQFSQVLLIQSILSKPWRMQVINLQMGFVMLEMTRVEPLATHPHPELIDCIRDLDAIQAKIRRPITIPNREITKAELQTIGKLCTILHHGELRAKWSGVATLAVGRDDAREMLKVWSQPGPKLFRQTGEATEELFGTEIPLGPAVLTIRDISIINMHDVMAKIDDPACEDVAFEFQFVHTANTTCLYQYPDWGAAVEEWADLAAEENGNELPS